MKLPQRGHPGTARIDHVLQRSAVRMGRVSYLGPPSAPAAKSPHCSRNMRVARGRSNLKFLSDDMLSARVASDDSVSLWEGGVQCRGANLLLRKAAWKKWLVCGIRTTSFAGGCEQLSSGGANPTPRAWSQARNVVSRMIVGAVNECANALHRPAPRPAVRRAALQRSGACALERARL
jgi:hypothetical protein